MKWLIKQSVEVPNRKFINDLTFKETHDIVMDLAGKLNKYTKDVSRVAICSSNSVDMALFFLALQMLGKEVLMLNEKLTNVEMTNQLKTLEIITVFSNDDRYISFETAKNSEKEDIDFRRLEEKQKIQNEDRISVILNTSATTGVFKSVPVKMKQIRAHVEASKDGLGFTEEDNWLLVLPMFHVGGLAIILRSLYNGTGVTILESFDEEVVVNLINEKKINMVSIIPTMLGRIIDRLSGHNLRIVLVGGEFIPRSLVDKCTKGEIPIYKTYGMTETFSQSTTVGIKDYPDKSDSVGLPLKGVDIIISGKDETGAGEIQIKSPMVMDGYIGKDFTHGYFNTGDIGYLDDDGFLYILDRRTNIIISGGENIYPLEIENVLYEHSSVQECAVIGVKDEKWGQVPVLYVVAQTGKGELLDLLKSKLAKYKIPKEIYFLDSLPKNASGKISKKHLKGLI